LDGFFLRIYFGRANNSDKEKKQMSQEETGTVKWFDARKGYGFIARENGGDIFVHANNISDRFARALEDGERVRFVVGQGPKGPSAEEVERIS
jgi:CspA family cold shock protein